MSTEPVIVELALLDKVEAPDATDPTAPPTAPRVSSADVRNAAKASASSPEHAKSSQQILQTSLSSVGC